MTGVLVYGTLRRGGALSGAWAWADPDVRQVTVPGLKLYGAGEGFPYALPDESESIAADLLTFDPSIADEIISDLDRIEGVEYQHYVRVMRTWFAGSDCGRAWCYIAHPTLHRGIRNEMAPVPNNDWITHRLVQEGI